MWLPTREFLRAESPACSWRNLEFGKGNKEKGKTSLSLRVLTCKMGTILVAPNRVLMRLSLDHGFVQLISPMCTEYLHWTRHRAGHWSPRDDNGNSKHSCHTCSVLSTLLSALSALKRPSLVGTRHMNHRKACFKCVRVLSQPSGELS